MYKRIRTPIAAAIALSVLAAGTASAQDRWDWSPGDRAYELRGPAIRLLYPELRDTARGRAFVMRNFDENGDGWINPREAEAANRAFALVAGPQRDRFDWEAQGRIGRDDRGPRHDRVVMVEDRGSGWDRAAMRGYRFRQTRLGATMTMQEDVLFRTDSAALRPGAVDKLEPLARYLRANPGVRVAIIGHTDSRGSDAHNQALSERRAESVRTGLDEMGVTRARFRVEGHGEKEPVATNATAAGMRLNRRVEVTLLGQRADRFSAD
jgi:outer membrane protein OmpA-like peptidoglycan-associated protein